MAASDDFKKKKAHGAFPIMETPEGKMVFESLAIASYFARNADCSELCGKSAFEQS
jgi:glutathione S-transferase